MGSGERADEEPAGTSVQGGQAFPGGEPPPWQSSPLTLLLEKVAEGACLHPCRLRTGNAMHDHLGETTGLSSRRA